MVGATCPRCSGVVALHSGRPVVTARGVTLWHPDCWEQRDVPLVVAEAHAPAAPRAESAPPIVPARVPVLRLAAGAGLAAALALLVIAQQALAGAPETAQQVSVDFAPAEIPVLRAASAAREQVPPKPERELALEQEHPLPEELVATFPTLATWVHPVAAAAERMPWNRARHFGAERAGIERTECGAGHCGVDLDGPRGRSIVAVADGVVVRTERRESGGDGISGRYVRIQHEDGSLTAYMHLDEVAPRLEAGDRVTQGQYLGTLGSTGVAANAPHLHFSLELPKHAKDRGDLRANATRYVDPAPFLLRATIADQPDRRRAVKPAF